MNEPDQRTRSFNPEGHALSVEQARLLEQACDRFEAACRVLDLPFTLSPGGGGSDANHYARHGIPCLVLACGMTDVHSVHESLSLDDLYDTARIARELMVRV